MFDSFLLPVLLLIFAVAAAVVWYAGIQLANTTDVLSKHLGLGEALGGIIVLAIVTNLPEIAITVSAALSGKVELAVGNILGGIALQTVVLVVLDAVGVGRKSPLTYQTNTLTPVLEGALVVAVLTAVVMGHQLPPSLLVARLSPIDILIIGSWLAGLYLIGKARTGLPWQPTNATKDDSGQTKDKSRQTSITRSTVIFAVAALATLIGGVLLEKSGDALASAFGMSGVLFGATVLAAATSLPEISTGLASIKNKDYQLAISDIFGGNAFLPVLFPLATLLTGKAVLPTAHKSDIYLTGLGILLTVVYLYGIVFRPKRQIARMGLDSFVVLLLYVVAIMGLFFIPST
jgi:cation:H+ antiporter